MSSQEGTDRNCSKRLITLTIKRVIKRRTKIYGAQFSIHSLSLKNEGDARVAYIHVASTAFSTPPSQRQGPPMVRCMRAMADLEHAFTPRARLPGR